MLLVQNILMNEHFPKEHHIVPQDLVCVYASLLFSLYVFVSLSSDGADVSPYKKYL